MSISVGRERSADVRSRPAPGRRRRGRRRRRRTRVRSRRAADRDVDVVDAVVQGAPHEAIGEYVDDHGIDLVVMATHDRTGLDRHLLGSTTDRVVRTVSVPVLVVSRPE